MKQTFKRIISLVLITVILASLIPVGAATDPAVDAKVKEIAAACRAEGLTDEWEIALWLHDWLIYNANYDYTYTYYHPEGVLLNGTGVCQSYAEAYELLLDEFGIDNMVLHAPEMNHAWNLVKLNGQWCHVDCTWDDPGEGGSERALYFGMTDDMIGRDHKWRKDIYPEATSEINYYFLRMGYPAVRSELEAKAYFANAAKERLDPVRCVYIGPDPDFRIYNVFKEWYDDAKYVFGVGGYSCSYSSYMITCSMAYFDDFITECEHSYLIDTVDPTCTEQGYTFYVCEYCATSFCTDFVEAKGHLYGSVTGYPATCTENGLTDGEKCYRCGEFTVKQQKIYATGHKTEIIHGYPSTCTENGYTDGERCTVCGVFTVKQQLLVSSGHFYVSTRYPSTCTEGGYTVYECYYCGDSYTDNYTDPTGHSYFTDVIYPTCTEQGYTYYCCNDCGHNYIGDYTDKVPHAYYTWLTQPTCDSQGYTTYSCVFCGHSYTTDYTDPLAHVYYTEITYPTCDSQGYTTHICCNCGHSYVDSYTEKEQHIWSEGDCSSPRVCFLCGAAAGAGSHSYSHQYDYKCDNCGEERNVDMTRPMVDMYRMYNPNTGEHFYTGSTVERDHLISVGWQYEGIGFTFPLTTGAPVHRLFQPSTGEHLYTMDEDELNYLLSEGWNYEGIAFNSGFENEVPQFRLHNPNATVGAYHFTASTVERDVLMAAGWEYQGIGWYSLGGN